MILAHHENACRWRRGLAAVLVATVATCAATRACRAAEGQRPGESPDSCRLHHCSYFDPDSSVYPKDFAFVYARRPGSTGSLFHLFYTRQHRRSPAAADTRSFGHAWSSDLRHWHADTSASVFGVSANAWDHAHVWAPTLLQVGSTFHLFYTGVDDSAPDPDEFGNQRIGHATTAAIDTGSATVWSRDDTPLYTANHTAWAWRDSSTRRQQFRDPFVIEDPDSAGRYLLFVVGQRPDGDYVAGVARNEPGHTRALAGSGLLSRHGPRVQRERADGRIGRGDRRLGVRSRRPGVLPGLEATDCDRIPRSPEEPACGRASSRMPRSSPSCVRANARA